VVNGTAVVSARISDAYSDGTAVGQCLVISYNGTMVNFSIWPNPVDVHTDVCVYYYGAEPNNAGEVKAGSDVQGTSSIWYGCHIWTGN